MDQYRKSSSTESGAAFFAVCRGKISEGLEYEKKENKQIKERDNEKMKEIQKRKENKKMKQTNKEKKKKKKKTTKRKKNNLFQFW